MKKIIITKLAQKFANFIYTQLQNSNSIKEIDFWYKTGIKLDSYMIVFHDIYLD